jgi:hypothetical protein
MQIQPGGKQMPRARTMLMALGTLFVAATLACAGSATPTATAPAVVVLTVIAVTSTAQSLPTPVIQPASPTPTAALNGGTATALPAGTLEPDCINTYQPVSEGATWTYAGSVVGKDVNKTWTQVDTITDVGSTSFLREVKLSDKTLVDTWKCTQDGLVAEQPDGGIFSAVLQGLKGSVTIKTTAVTGVTIPVSFKAGDAWQEHLVLEISNLADTDVPAEMNLLFTAVGPEPVSVPAGAFSAMRVKLHVDLLVHSGKGLLTTLDGDQWMVPVLGVVKRSGQLTLIQGQQPAQLEMDLVSDHIS